VGKQPKINERKFFEIRVRKSMIDDFRRRRTVDHSATPRLFLLPWNRPSSAGDRRTSAWLYIGSKNYRCSLIGGRTAVEGFSRTAE
jgi:hypothetical protein